MVREYGDRIAFLGVPGRDGTGPMQDFVDRHDLQPMTHAVDTDGSLWGRFGVSYQPAWVFVAADGEVTRHFGPLSGAALRDQLDSLVSG